MEDTGPLNPKSLATFSYAPAGIRTKAVVRDSMQNNDNDDDEDDDDVDEGGDDIDDVGGDDDNDCNKDDGK